VGILADDAVEWMTRAEFQALALTERVRLLSAGSVQFYRGPQQVSAMEAMRGVP
jgi:hypothetical protein